MTEVYPIQKIPTKMDPKGKGWSVDLLLICGGKKVKGFYIPNPRDNKQGNFFVYDDREPEFAGECTTLPESPTHWQYA